ncbi:A/G-specific adenine glycosylase [Lutimaribacter sp. EGI FJ00015]|uniref:A/G-specific adenine glycosylase n=1 Tax=Lutimaribacter degradans TaxID=2945989 RepID=A0ACC5ZYK4_9RHOB|nr:A/G-specific adenine glycosylase [Lutimaribacter sp. EGI FJ00013]MCM2563387.1 A/G-specific adenine glycosylase [Lutimaribacter sp. EGI FJ00013]MCO0614534.1 A/G-specific adenine glycosylase [Lutimaribacter sp. EGI FJ00015]MCO0637207.1 A/G-specific adenine glycosylase [Lutimaribacter sp. EGI FJ00014]
MREKPRASELLAWYDRHARDMPWRVPPGARKAGQRPDPYAVWLSEVMLQQTTVAAVRGYFHRFTLRWPTVSDLAAAQDTQVMAEWAGLGYYARARNLMKCARTVVAEHGGEFPDTREGLQALPGIGPYTASAIAAIAFGRPETVVDGNVERVMARLYDVATPLPTAKKELTQLADGITPDQRPGDYAQAVMDLGATICTPRNPACGICPWRAPCRARAAGTAPDLPLKLPKKPKPVRVGYAYVGRRADGAWLMERRPDSGLLGGMLGWPGSDWAEIPPAPAPPLPADWHMLTEEARHTFTHFHLRLKVLIADLPVDAAADHGHFIPRDEFRPSDLPTAMRKVFDLAHSAFTAVSTGPAEDR